MHRTFPDLSKFHLLLLKFLNFKCVIFCVAFKSFFIRFYSVPLALSPDERNRNTDHIIECACTSLVLQRKLFLNRRDYKLHCVCGEKNFYFQLDLTISLVLEQVFISCSPFNLWSCVIPKQSLFYILFSFVRSCINFFFSRVLVFPHQPYRCTHVTRTGTQNAVECQYAVSNWKIA